MLRVPARPDEPPIEWMVRPFQRFAKEQASGGIVLLLCTAAALVWANTSFQGSYESLWERHITIGIGDFVLDEPLHFWINDALMAIFFFVVGLEIKRAVAGGELSNPRRAALPAVAAVGGMLIPAAIFTAFNGGGEGARGWAIPASTDIAFSLGVLALLGSRAPLSLKLFLTAFAIVDDIGAVVIIAIFFTEEIAWVNLAVGGGFLVLLAAMNRIGVRHPLIYGALGAIVWLAFLKSGVHATVAGVAVAGIIPMRVRIDADQFLEKGRAILDTFGRTGETGERVECSETQHAAIHELETLSKDVESPLQRMEHDLHPWVAFVIMPLFALANAGVSLDGSLGETLGSPVTLGAILGLVVGKQVGITLFAWLAVRTGIADLPQDISWRQIYGVAWLGGIGFTMSIFVGGLALTDPELVDQAKVGILVASVVSGIVGWMVLNGASQGRRTEPSRAGPGARLSEAPVGQA